VVIDKSDVLEVVENTGDEHGLVADGLVGDVAAGDVDGRRLVRGGLLLVED